MSLLTRLSGIVGDAFLAVGLDRSHGEVVVSQRPDLGQFQCNGALAAAREQQAATAEILQVISESPTDVQPVFDAIVNSGVRLFPGAMITVARLDGETVRAAAVAHEDAAMVSGWRERFTTPLSRERLHAAAILDAPGTRWPIVG